MSGTVLIIVNGEVLANEEGSSIASQRTNADLLADGLFPLFSSENKIALMHGNKPQVGFVLFRSEIASHVLHPIPLDVCGADTQGATGYMLSQAFTNVLVKSKHPRKVVTLLTQAVVDEKVPAELVVGRAIGPRYDREKAEQLRQTRGWQITKEQGRGYRRTVPTYPVKSILEIDSIKSLVDMGNIVVAGGGGGIPVVVDDHGAYRVIEAVVETEEMACMMANQLGAQVLLSIIETDGKFILSGLSTEDHTHLSHAELKDLLKRKTIHSGSVQRILKAADKFLTTGGEQVLITTIRKLPDALEHKSGLRIGSLHSSVELF